MMQKRLVQATATAVIFASMAMPALASEGKGNGFGKLLHVRLEGRHDNGLHLGWFKNGKAEHDEDEDEDKKNDLSSCLETAREAHDAAIKAAAKTYRTAQADARSDYHEAVKAAQKAQKTALKDARATFKLSVKDKAAIEAYASAKLKAHTDFSTAMKKAYDGFKAAKIAAEKAWKEAKVKADADFKAAKQACAPAPAPTPTPVDTTAPAAVSLSLSAATANSILVSWTATGDDGATGTAASCDLRYSTAAITDANFASATQVAGEPAPAVAGTAQSMTVTGLTAGTAYHFAMKCQDEKPNVSALSNAPTLSTLLADTTAPAAITTVLLSGATASSVTMTWIASGDDGITGTAASYDVRYSTSPITTQANFDAATQASGEPTPAVAGLTQSMTVSGLTAATTYYFAIEAKDEAGNTSTVSNNVSLSTL